MNKFEAVVLLSPELGTQNLKSEIDKFKSLIAKKEGKIMVKRIIILLFLTIQSVNILTIQSVNADECTYKTETISENGVIVSTKQIKVCNETVYMSNGFWHDLMYSEQGNELFWNAVIFVFSMTGG